MTDCGSTHGIILCALYVINKPKWKWLIWANGHVVAMPGMNLLSHNTLAFVEMTYVT